MSVRRESFPWLAATAVWRKEGKNSIVKDSTADRKRPAVFVLWGGRMHRLYGNNIYTPVPIPTFNKSTHQQINKKFHTLLVIFNIFVFLQPRNVNEYLYKYRFIL